MTSTILAFVLGALIGPMGAVTFPCDGPECEVFVVSDEKAVTFEVTGLICAARCAQKVQVTLEGVRGVRSVDLGQKVGDSVKVEVIAESSVAESDLIKALEQAGFGASAS